MSYRTQDATVIETGGETYHPQQTLAILRQLIDVIRWRSELADYDGSELTEDELAAFKAAETHLDSYSKQ